MDFRFINQKALLIAFLFIFCYGFSQKESANWYFGSFAGLDFNSGTPVPHVDGRLETHEGCATISDANGNLLFYTDGVTVWDRRHNIMPNGTGLLGHSSSTASAIIIPKPGTTTSYYIFTVDKPSYYLTEGLPVDGVNYSEVDMALNSGYGDIVSAMKNKHLITYNTSDSFQSEYKCSEKITAVNSNDGSSIWVITQFMNKFYSFRVDANGVNETPIVSTVQQTVRPLFNADRANVTAIGYLKVSPDGKKIAIAHSSTSLGSPRSGTKKSGKILLYDFNNSTGAVSNQQSILDGWYPYGLEFSPNSKLLYATVNYFDDDDTFNHSHLFQYNLESSNIENSQVDISSSDNVAGALQLAMNGKIYRAGYRTGSIGLELSVINKPNELGTSCAYSHNSVNLAGQAAALGLPPFVQSIFLYTFDYENICLGDQTRFIITSDDPYDTVLWDFGDGQTSTLEEPTHVFTQPGVHTVSMTLYLNGIERGPFLKQLIISEPPQVLQTTFDLIQCDEIDNDPNDGRAPFNLQLANAPLTFNTSEAIQVYYYHSITDAQNDIDNTNAINNVYTNQTQGEILHAKIYKANTACYSMATIRLNTTQAVDLNATTLGACDPDEDGFADFDLESKGLEIASSLNLPSNVTISFFETENDAAIGRNVLPNIYGSNNRVLYVRAESDNACYGTGTLNLDVRSFPQLQDQVIDVCLSDFPITIESGIGISQSSNYNFEWNTGEINDQIVVSQAGQYDVRVIDPLLNCEDTVSITVNQNNIPVVQDISINDYNVTVQLADNSEGFEYALDDQFGFYQDSNVFINVPAGTHTVFVKDVYNCNIISEEIYVLGFPKYFTPNDDGTHDTWNVLGLDPSEFQYQTVTVQIFDRYGKLLKTFNPYRSKGWNGKYNGKLLTPDDYWYYLVLPDGRKYRGHFSLKV
ncbi:T9SS type B sorting domain-containing protein [Yeosuana sp. MJ-SS3]|uniref:T9SS type B sorting domain-containing protein n=1 Tax=Gilvirhabdus luticola TaxID=3079858 RepID=A0ABU3U8W9_9FLAO|nr:T9SS type B sorting domain-containing protein [Yeosuana sp. MJ-SS3]MDU8886843.1 T9SS type B sorting domain-containing protein [Yeosuana sp. MJ-SS3]